jgi:hypothetical protein
MSLQEKSAKLAVVQRELSAKPKLSSNYAMRYNSDSWKPCLA